MCIAYVYVRKKSKIVLGDVVIDIENLPKELYKIRPSLQLHPDNVNLRPSKLD